MEKVGLDYLSLDRETSSLSGERLKESVWPVNRFDLSGVLYVLDEPSWSSPGR